MAIVTFKSKAGGDVTMLPGHARVVFAAMGLELAPQGALEPDQLVVALQRLAAELMAEEDAVSPEVVDTPHGSAHDQQEPPEMPIGLHLRSQPLRSLFERAVACGVPVYWGF